MKDNTEVEHRIVPTDEPQTLSMEIKLPTGTVVTVTASGFETVEEALIALGKAGHYDTLEKFYCAWKEPDDDVADE